MKIGLRCLVRCRKLHQSILLAITVTTLSTIGLSTSFAENANPQSASDNSQSTKSIDERGDHQFSDTVSGIRWRGVGIDQGIQIDIDGDPAHYQEQLSDPRRNRIVIEKSSLATSVVDINGRGRTLGVFPFVSADTSAVYVDIVLDAPGEVIVESNADGLIVYPPDSELAVAVQKKQQEQPVEVASAELEQVNEADSIANEEIELAEKVVPIAAVVNHASRPSTDAMNNVSTEDATAVSGEQAKTQIAESAPTAANLSTQVESVATGAMRAAAVTLVAANTSAAVEPVVLTGIRYSPLPGGRIQIDIDTDIRPLEPGAFVTNKPTRLALDFFGAQIGFEERNIDVGLGPLQSIVAIQTKDRVRVVFNLVQTVGYETQILDDGIAVTLDATSAAVSATTLQSRMFPEKADGETEHQISKIDFRRDKDGGGRIIVELSDPKIGVDVKETAGELVVDFVDTGIAAELEQRLDVVDFATPVQTIDTFRQGEHTRMIVTPSGRYRQLAYQSGNVFSLTVSPLTEQEIEEETKDEFGYSGEKLSLNFQKISVRAALQVIADFTGLNFVTSDSVKGTLTLRLQDVPWDQALDIILQTKGLAMRQKGNVVWVAPATEIAAKERQQLEASQQVAELEPLLSELVQVNYAKASDIADLLKSIEPVHSGVETGAFGSVSFEALETESNTLLSPRGQVTVDERTNSLLIQDTASKISEIRKLISKLDRPVRQVLIETRIVEASDDFSRVLGARLGFARQSENTRFPGSRGSNVGTVTLSGNVEDLATINNDGFTTVNNDGLAVNLPARGIGAETAGSFAISVEKVSAGMWNLLNLELSALEATGGGKVIASPKIMTANQQEAIIKQGQERVFPPSGFNTKPTRDEAVLLLQVKPQITPDDRLVLDVRVKQDVFVDTTINVKDKKEVQTQVLLDNGETVVIGGIYQEQTRQDLDKIPLLGDIPLLGNLFKRKSRDHNRKELLVFLTPRILDNTVNLR